MDFLLCSASSSRLNSLYSNAGCDKEKKLKGVPPKDRFVKGKADGDPNRRTAAKGVQIS